MRVFLIIIESRGCWWVFY